MKNIIGTIGVALLLMGCSSSESKTTRQVFIVDVSDEQTDELTVFEDGGIGLPSEDTWDGHITRYAVIANTEYAKVTEYKLESANQLLSNEGERRAEVREYRDKLHSLKHNDSTEYVGSLIWSPLWHELHYLSQDSTVETTVYLVSDLLEFNTWINLYNPKTRRTLQSEPEKIRERFQERIQALKHTNHIELVLIHEPSENTQTNEYYALIVEQIYKPIMQEAGVKVSVQSQF